MVVRSCLIDAYHAVCTLIQRQQIGSIATANDLYPATTAIELFGAFPQANLTPLMQDASYEAVLSPSKTRGGSARTPTH